ncbi:hypothetical protein ACPOL_3516 [Acidisarcina polymorpha]|uniref:Uncharacterized protein n=1 Tax=Acidisarcina polymorpha TaxID=2211140 RepID=A0A2Z5G0W7_9BACT|nr:hypothetical protein ACPOL_3516 [Acidisarcina polymorpha]
MPRQMERRRAELDCCNSSDALLMNVFCYPGVLARNSVRSILGVDRRAIMEFGFRPYTPLNRNGIDRTEIDLRIGDVLIEAKLIEADFQSAQLPLLQRYRDFESVFDVESLSVRRGMVASYQLVRGVLAAVALNCSYCVLCDQRRPDLIEEWYRIMRAIPSAAIRSQLKVLTWQEIARALSRKQQAFLAEKYGILPS